MIRIEIPAHLRMLARVDGGVTLTRSRTSAERSCGSSPLRRICPANRQCPAAWCGRVPPRSAPTTTSRSMRIRQKVYLKFTVTPCTRDLETLNLLLYRSQPLPSDAPHRSGLWRDKDRWQERGHDRFPPQPKRGAHLYRGVAPGGL